VVILQEKYICCQIYYYYYSANYCYSCTRVIIFCSPGRLWNVAVVAITVAVKTVSVLCLKAAWVWLMHCHHFNNW